MTDLHADLDFLPPCPTCGHRAVRIRKCVCGHEAIYHDIRKDGTRGRCLAGAGLPPVCPCPLFAEEQVA